MQRSPNTLLRQLDQTKDTFDENAAAAKLTILRELQTAKLRQPTAVCRLHDILSFLAAYPDNEELLMLVRCMLAGFRHRRDLARLRRRLAGTGIAGTDTHYSFFAPTARWLATGWPKQLAIDWPEFDQQNKLDELLGLLSMLALYAETPGLDEAPLSVREWLDRLRGPDETDAAFLIKRLAALPLDPFAWESIFNSLGLPLKLSAGVETPNRSRAQFPVDSIHFQNGRLDRSRPRVPATVKRKPQSVTHLSPRDGEQLADLARTMMVAFNRELDAFSYASAKDATLVDCGRGLTYAFIGVEPDRRLLLESMYGYLVLKNGMPIGYGTVSSLFGSSEIAFNLFEPFRGGEGALIFVQLMAASRHLFGSDTFTLYPYQLGEDNPEAIRSGAWWFYQKLGFRTREPEVLELMEKELRRMSKRRGHRSTPATLRQLATANVYLHLGRARDDVIGILATANVGLAVTDYLSRRFGSDRARASRECVSEAAELLGVAKPGTTSSERLAWQRWAPLVLILPGVDRWPAADRKALAALVVAKGGQREIDYVQRFNSHRRLRSAIRKLARG